MFKDPRFTAAEAKDVINKISSLKGLLAPVNEDGAPIYRDDGNNSRGFLYKSRFNKEIPITKVKNIKVKNNTTDIVFEESEDSNGNVKFHLEESLPTLKPTKHLDKKRRFAMSLASLASKQEKRLSAVKEGAIGALIELSIINDIFVQRSCATAFSQLASYSGDGIRSRMIEEGAIAAVIALSNTENYDVKYDCCQALCNLTSEQGSEFRAAKDNVASTVMHIAALYPENIDLCLKVLLNLSCVSEKYARIEDISEAIAHFNHPNVSLTLDQDELVLSILCNLSALRNNQLRLVEDGCLKLIEKAWRSSLPSLRKLACDNIRNLTTDQKTRSKLLEQDILSLLLSMARDGLEDIKISAMKALYNLSKDISCRFRFASHPAALSSILKVCREKFTNIEIARTAARTLKVLGTDPITAAKLVQDDIVEGLLSLIANGDDRITQLHCVDCICESLQIDGVRNDLVNKGAMKVVISLVKDDMDPTIAESCAFAMYCVCCRRLCSDEVIETEILPHLIVLCESKTNGPKTKNLCAAALSAVTEVRQIDSSNAIDVLIDMLGNEIDKSTKAYCATALYNLAESHKNCQLMLEKGSLTPLVSLTKTEPMLTKVKCAAILSRLALHKEYYHLFEANDVLRVLLDLSSIDHTITQRRIVIALSNLSQNEQLRKQLIDLNPIPYINSLAAKRDELLWRGIVSIICNLSYELGSERTMVKGGIVRTLLITALINADHIQSKITCVKAIANLLADASIHKQMIEEGLIWGISTLALLDNLELLTLCAKAICILSGQFGREMIDSGATSKALFKIINEPGVELQRLGGRALTNILLKTNDSDEKFRSHVVEHMGFLVSSKDEEVREMCVLCLCLVSQSEACVPAIVDSNLLRMIDASSLFTDASLSYAYLTMLGNIANNPNMRTKLLDEQSIPRFLQICQTSDPNLDMATIKAIYNITCAPENIPILAEQNMLSIVDTVWNADYPKTTELIHHLAAILHNMSIDPPHQAKAIQQDAARIYVNIWSHSLVRENSNIKKLLCSGICHLACGNVNSAKMVESGCTSILMYVTQTDLSQSKASKKQSFSASNEMYHRCAAAMRNLLCTVSNQPIMIAAGCLEGLIGLFQKADALTNRDEIRKNCAAALRCLTFNTSLRPTILSSGAIDVILADLADEMRDDEDPSLSRGLLVQLEAESWTNGVRGLKREGRARAIPPDTIFGDLITSTVHVHLDVEIRHVDIDKYYVEFSVDDQTNPLDAVSLHNYKSQLRGFSNTVINLNRLRTPRADDKDSHSHDLDFMERFISSENANKKEVHDDDEGTVTIVQQCSKVECKVEYSLKLNNKANDLEFFDTHSLYTEDPIDQPHQSNYLPELKSDYATSLEPSPNQKSFVATSFQSNDESLPKLLSSSMQASSSQALGGLPSASGSSKKLSSTVSKPKTRRINSDEKFKQIVSLIKHSKQSKGALIGDVINEWNNISKF